MKGGIRSINTPVYDITLYELLKTYSNFKMQKAFQRINIPKLPLLSTEAAIKQLRENLNELTNWREIQELIPKHFFENKNKKRTGLAGIFAGSLELSKEGVVNIMQEEMFGKILIKKSN